MTESAANLACPYCQLSAAGHAEAVGGWIEVGDHYLVQHGEPESSGAGAVKIVARRHFVDFADMTEFEATAFGSLVSRLDRAIRQATAAERVHLVSTRDRVAHFHAWLYPRPASSPLRGTAFLAAPQESSRTAAEAASAAIRAALVSG